MSEEPVYQESNLFKSLILNFQMSAMMGMGKIINPVTQKADRKMSEAKFSIDMLNMLAEKTKGNLNDEDDRLLQQTLTDLRLNYINEKEKPEPEVEESKPDESKVEETNETAEKVDPSESKRKSKKTKSKSSKKKSK